MRPSADENARLRRILASAAGDFVNLVVAGSSVIAALAAGSWGLLMLGGAIYMVLTAWKASSPSYWQKVLAADTERLRLPDPARVNDIETRKTVVALNAGRAEVLRVLTGLPEDLQPHLRFAEPSLNELESCAAQLVARAEELAGYMRTVNREAILTELRRLEDLLRRARDEEAQREYASAQQSRQEQLAVLDQLGRIQERLQASLQRLLAIVEGLPSRMVRLRMLDQETRVDLGAELDEELLRVNEEMLTAEHSLRAMMASRRDLLSDGLSADGLGDARLLLGLPEAGLAPESSLRASS